MITAAEATKRIATAKELEAQKERERDLDWCDNEIARDIASRSDAKLSFVAYDLEKRLFNNTFITAAVAFLQAFDFAVSVEDIGSEIRMTVEWPSEESAAQVA